MSISRFVGTCVAVFSFGSLALACSSSVDPQENTGAASEALSTGACIEINNACYPPTPDPGGCGGFGCVKGCVIEAGFCGQPGYPQCGPFVAPACGNVINCGTCGAGLTCSAAGQCVSDVCTPAPATCTTSEGAQCGVVSLGCGATTDCGECSSNLTCVGHVCMTKCPTTGKAALSCACERSGGFWNGSTCS